MANSTTCLKSGTLWKLSDQEGQNSTVPSVFVSPPFQSTATADSGGGWGAEILEHGSTVSIFHIVSTRQNFHCVPSCNVPVPSFVAVAA